MRLETIGSCQENDEIEFALAAPTIPLDGQTLFDHDSVISPAIAVEVTAYDIRPCVRRYVFFEKLADFFINISILPAGKPPIQGPLHVGRQPQLSRLFCSPTALVHELVNRIVS